MRRELFFPDLGKALIVCLQEKLIPFQLQKDDSVRPKEVQSSNPQKPKEPLREGEQKIKVYLNSLHLGMQEQVQIQDLLLTS